MSPEVATDIRFLEVEHKFVVPESFDVAAFESSLLAWNPEKHYATEVCDDYYLLKAVPRLVYRHRYDGLIQQLTVKGIGDNEARLEVNLDLGLDHGNQASAVDAFLKPLGILHRARLQKLVKVFYFPTVEIVFYRASHQDSKVSCIEIEARHPRSMDEAKAQLALWEDRLGLDPASRCRESLLHLLVLPRLPEQLRQSFL